MSLIKDLVELALAIEREQLDIQKHHLDEVAQLEASHLEGLFKLRELHLSEVAQLQREIAALKNENAEFQEAFRSRR